SAGVQRTHDPDNTGVANVLNAHGPMIDDLAFEVLQVASQLINGTPRRWRQPPRASDLAETRSELRVRGACSPEVLAEVTGKCIGGPIQQDFGEDVEALNVEPQRGGDSLPQVLTDGQLIPPDLTGTGFRLYWFLSLKLRELGVVGCVRRGDRAVPI